jgi:hypothetical protein
MQPPLFFGVAEPVFKAPAGKYAKAVHEHIFDFAESAVFDSLLEIEVLRLKAQTLTDHQLFAVFFRGFDHDSAVL